MKQFISAVLVCFSLPILANDVQVDGTSIGIGEQYQFEYLSGFELINASLGQTERNGYFQINPIFAGYNLVTLQTSQGPNITCVDGGSTLKAHGFNNQAWEAFVKVDLPDNQIAFINHEGYYVSAQPDGTVLADRRNLGDWETFTVQAVGGGVVKLLTYHGTYLKTQPGTCRLKSLINNGYLSPANCSSGVVYADTGYDGCELTMFESGVFGQVILAGETGLHFQAYGGVGGDLWENGTAKGLNERITVTRTGPATVAVSINGYYIRTLP